MYVLYSIIALWLYLNTARMYLNWPKWDTFCKLFDPCFSDQFLTFKWAGGLWQFGLDYMHLLGGLDWFGPDWFRPDWFGPDWFRTYCFRPDLFGTYWFRLDWFEFIDLFDKRENDWTDWYFLWYLLDPKEGLWVRWSKWNKYCQVKILIFKIYLIFLFQKKNCD